MTETKRRADVHAGDLVEVTGHYVGEKPRLGEILEVLGTPDHPHYRVRWEDGHESIYYADTDATMRPASRRAGKAT